MQLYKFAVSYLYDVLGKYYETLGLHRHECDIDANMNCIQFEVALNIGSSLSKVHEIYKHPAQFNSSRSSSSFELIAKCV